MSLGALGASRVLLAPEEHGAGRQLLRFRIYPWVPPAWLVLAVLSLALGVLAATGGVWLAAVPLGLAAALVAARASLDSGRAIDAVRGALDEVLAEVVEPEQAEQPESWQEAAERVA